MSSGQIVDREDRDGRTFESERLIVMLETAQSLVRELAGVVERAVAVCDSISSRGSATRTISSSFDTFRTMDGGAGSAARPLAAGERSLGDLLESFEKEALQRALESAGGNRARAARLLGTTERIFNYRVRKYGIDWKRYRR